MNIFNWIKYEIKACLRSAAISKKWPEKLPFERITVEPPRDASNGDIATNAAMILAKPIGIDPYDIYLPLAEGLKKLESVKSVEIVEPGFINIRLLSGVWLAQVSKILEFGQNFGSSRMGAGRKVNVEYVSANPTGPLHAAHARGAVFGDALASLLEKAGFQVVREYYVNDVGSQIDKMAHSVYFRYLEALNANSNIPECDYPGEYLKDLGKALVMREGDNLINALEQEWLEPVRTFAVELIMTNIMKDLLTMGIHMDRFSSERAIVKKNVISRALAKLEEAGLVYRGVLTPPKGKCPDDWEPRPQLLFRSTKFGDDVDRPLQKPDGSWTYFSNDIAYHMDKVERGYMDMIDVFGADHGGYVNRIKAAVSAITAGQGNLDVKLCQIVHMLDGGKPVRMSKRSGNFVTLSEVLDTVGPDVLRFIMLTRRNDQTLEFDYRQVSEQSRNNPVFYVQYAHARACSVIRNAKEIFVAEDLSDFALSQAEINLLTDHNELKLSKLLASWPRVVESAASSHEPHRVAFYLANVAAAFHELWSKGRENARLRFILKNEREITMARIALVRATATVIASGLKIIGVTPMDELRG
ncbi:arginyl-tRNA synthetase [Candidatus Endolissoclinum faulkneri L5]|uniref:Arginine--tRNA ligase n=1 Tax=Candidatus Endolissoclinum faulkneri L5 TaxID=1401328 RepID=V9TT68_9PROT|nr:arginine--tRNA ligase [Candidatus Endolissoclinum faulkneri]AHC73771.1 arginyl-tRNA synthetase [Candidatus Endolissoclinum faulkneri L5]